MSEETPNAKASEPQPGAPAEPDGAPGQPTTEADAASMRNGFATSAASNPNRSSRSLSQHRSAERQLLGGSLQDAVMGDKNVTNVFYGAVDGSVLLEVRLSAEQLDEANAFVAPRDYAKLESFAVGRPLTVISGSPGSGRTAAAVHLLCSATGRQAIHVLHPDTDFATLAAQPLPKACGIVLPDITARAAGRLDEFALRRLLDMLITNGQKMVVAAAPTVVWGCPSVNSYLAPFGPRPDPQAVVAAQFRYRFSASMQTSAHALLQRQDVAALIRAHSGPERPLAEAALLASLLKDASADPESMAANAELGLRAGQADDLERWFEGLAGTRGQNQCYAIALAVLNGLPNEKVTSAGIRLERLLAPETAEARDQQRGQDSPFSGRNSLRLQQLRAIQVPDERTTDPEGKRDLIVRYINRDLPRRLLAHVWQQYDAERGAVTRWLRELGSSGLEDVRIKAGVTVGALAKGSYDHINDTVITPWAESGNINQQDAAAVALQTLGTDTRFAAPIKATLDEWSQIDSRESLQVTAARAYGAPYGTTRLDEAIKALTRLATVDRLHVAIAVARSLTELIADDYGEATARVFRLLGEWVSGRKRLLRTTGRMVFLFAAADLVARRRPNAGSGEAGGRTWPAFLHMDQDPHYSPII